MSEASNGNNGQQFAAELRRIREGAGLSQEQMALRLGMGYAPNGGKVSTGRAAVSAWEAGKRRPPTEYVKAYIEFGGDPLILTVQPEPRSQLQTNGASADDGTAEGEPIIPTAPVELPDAVSDSVPGRGPRPRPHPQLEGHPLGRTPTPRRRIAADPAKSPGQRTSSTSEPCSGVEAVP